MKMFEAADGALINPSHVMLVRAYKSEGKNFVQFAFSDDTAHEFMTSSASYAEGEIKAFKQHCDET